MAEEVIPNARETLLVLSARFPQATFIMEVSTTPAIGDFQNGWRAPKIKLGIICGVRHLPTHLTER